MKKIIDKIKKDQFNSKLFNSYFQDKKIAVFDIETTGLSPSFAKVILTGIFIVENGTGTVTQFFAEELEDEFNVISETVKILEEVDVIVTYNGRSFDMPFMKQRAKNLGIEWKLDTKLSLDLYVVVSKHSTLGQSLPNLKQKSIETFMGFQVSREDEISGAESVALYNEYLRTKDKEKEEFILLHNHDDVIQLYNILPVIGYVDFHSAMGSMGILTENYLVTKIDFLKRQLRISGLQRNNPSTYIAFPTDSLPAHIEMTSENLQFTITIEAEFLKDATYIDLHSFLKTPEILEKYPSYVNGYLILKDKDIIDYSSTNLFIKSFLEELEI